MLHHLLHAIWALYNTAAKHSSLFSIIINTNPIIGQKLLELQEKPALIKELSINQFNYFNSLKVVALNLYKSVLVIEHTTTSKNQKIIKSWHVPLKTLNKIANDINIFGDYHFLDSNCPSNLTYIYWLNTKRPDTEVIIIGFTNELETTTVDELLKGRFISLNLEKEPTNILFDSSLSLIMYSYQDDNSKYLPYVMV
jgi:hypothetical protein